MEKDLRNPSETIDSYWIYAENEKNNYTVKRANSGKWLIFEHKSKIDEIWSLIRKATTDGILGNSSKTSTNKSNKNASNADYCVICVFTANYNNHADVKRIEQNIRSLKITNKLIYKLDKDVGKYKNQGHQNLDQEYSYSNEYYLTLESISNGKGKENIQFIGLNSLNKKEFKFFKLNLTTKEYLLEKRELHRLGFNIHYDSDTDHSFTFSE